MKLLSLTVVLGLTFLLLANRSFGIHLDNQPVVRSFDMSPYLGGIIFTLFVFHLLRKK
jgi:hypothetical protein